MWKNEKFTLTKIVFRQINSLVIYLVNALLSRKFCQYECKSFDFIDFISTVLENGNFALTTVTVHACALTLRPLFARAVSFGSNVDVRKKKNRWRYLADISK